MDILAWHWEKNMLTPLSVPEYVEMYNLPVLLMAIRTQVSYLTRQFQYLVSSSISILFHFFRSFVLVALNHFMNGIQMNVACLNPDPDI